MTIITTELRYFFADSTEPELQRALQSWLKAEGQRTDIYRKFQRSENVGIKWRDGKIEVKSLVKNHENGTPPCQTWEKIALGTFALEGQCIEVKKKRWLHFLNHELEEVNPEIEGNCQVEISKVHVLGKDYWSLCLEVGNLEIEKERLDLLEHVWRNLRARYPRLQKLVRGKTPMSYPEFLLAASKPEDEQ